MKEIPVQSKGKLFSAKVSDEDFDKLKDLYWTLLNKGYVVTGSAKNRVFMHHLVHPVCIPDQVDHKDGDKLNNQRDNLRTCTNKQNCSGKKLAKNNTTGFKGVCKASPKTWLAYIQPNNVFTRLGTFPTPELAALAYDKAARALFGDFARLNFP